MSSLNQIVLVGTVDTDAHGVPHRGTTPAGLELTKFRIRVAKPARHEGDPPRFDVFPVEAVGRLAASAALVRPGSVVAVEGRLRTYRDDQNRTKVLVDASLVQSLEDRPIEQAYAAAPATGGLPRAHSPAPSQPASLPPQDPGMDGPDEGDFEGSYPF